jgi:hypothetical protein
MSAVSVELTGRFVARHCPAAEYPAASLSHSGSTRRAWRRDRREFIEHYPDLRSGLEAPLVERVGRLLGESVDQLG